MPSSTSDFTVNVNDVLYVDRWGISTLSDFTTTVNIQVWNQSPQPIYVKAVINDPNGNWKFDGDTTAKQLGSVVGFDYANFKATLKRAVPSSDVEDEQFTITFEFYKDSSYSQKVDQISKTIKANIIDFHASPSGWTVNIDDFDDGTAQGWTLNLFSITQDASIEAGGYGAYYKSAGSSGTKLPSLTKTISIPSTITKAGILFYWGVFITGCYECTNKFKYVKIYVDGTKVYEDYVNVSNSGSNPGKSLGWYQASIDLTQWKGQNVEIKIEMEGYTPKTNVWIIYSIDDVIFAYK